MPHIAYLCRWPSKLRRRARRSRLLTMLLPILILLALLTPIYLIYKPPSLLLLYLQHRFPTVLWRVSTPSKTIALTIDDAPSQHTLEIMQILKENNATATFFVIGSQVHGDEEIEILQELIRNGHELANHAMHDEPSRSLTNNQLTSQILSVETLLARAYAPIPALHPPKYFRPGSGFFNARMLDLLSSLDYKLVLGSIYPHDAQIPYWRVNARHILSMLRPGGIIICHDRRAWTAPMLRRVLPEMRGRGWRVVSVTELVKVGEEEGR
ncbi:hypothetical protein JMJ35_007496 [Cladonia borealis]|uniref:chitin deacetylase n=1 Tax=Cladonia borealis TaxID=184061 RepID=A0AA39UZT4_9LECA|nr:hypothetical protein JMJ35_007496 [Cladonia borealis]